MGTTNKIYSKLPLCLQHSAISIFGIYWHWLRFWGSYRSHLQGYKQRTHFTVEEWKDYQHEKLKQVLKICVNTVPYYRDHWSDQEKSAILDGDLNKLPLFEKDEIRRDPEAFCRDDLHPFPILKHHTSGTTGTPIQSMWTVSEYRNTLALREARSANWAGVSFKYPRATISGRLVEPSPNRFNAVYRFNAIEKQVYFSAFHLKPETARNYIEALRKYDIQWLTGYAVSYYLLAKYILEQNIAVPSLQAVITTSEKLTPEMREIMEKAYGCPIFEEYSTVENALFASECEEGRLHVSPDVSIVEILKPDGSPCVPGEVGEVISTCLMRYYQPLIRFRLGDLAAWDPDPCPCGRQMPVIKEVVGRIEDVVTGPDGRQLVRFHGIFTDQPHIIEAQVIQESLQEFTIIVVPNEKFDLEDVEDIQQRMKKRLGDEIRVKVKCVEKIERTKAGKFKAVISRITDRGFTN